MKALNPQSGNFEKIYVKALDSMPVGSEIDFDGSASDIPIGWEQVSGKSLVAYELWNNPASPTTAFAGQSITLSESISNFSYYEIIYKYTISDYGVCTQSTGKVPVSELARLIDISGGVPNFRNVTALSGTTMTFDDCKYYQSYLNTQTTNYNPSCVPIQIIGYKEA